MIWMDGVGASVGRKGMNIEEEKRCAQDRGEWRRVVYSWVVIVCLKVVGGCFGTPRCGHPDLSGNGRAVKKNSNTPFIFFIPVATVLSPHTWYDIFRITPFNLANHLCSLHIFI
jgi:hypothetical protein